MFRKNLSWALIGGVIAFVFLAAFNNCTQRPQVESTTLNSTSFQHADKMTSCLPCHIPDRAVPSEAGYVHYNNQDCVTCHTPATWSKPSWHFRNPAQPTCIHCHRKDQPAVTTTVTTHYNNADCLLCHQAALTPGITWASRKAYAHSPTPTSCAVCHEKDRSRGANHPAAGDCVSCHTPTQW